jgi:hypothetical protein
MNADIATLRASLVAIQRSEPLHARIYAEGLAFCPRCPSRKACKAASLRLAEMETRVIGGAA